MGHYLYTPGCNFGKCCKPKSSATARGYVFGGSVSATANEEYETIGDSWASKTAVPAPGRASHTSTSLLAADAHCIGDGGHTADNDAYTVAADSWTSKTDLAYTLGGAAAETLSGKIYTAGGFKNGAPAGLTRNTDEYAPADSWTAKTDMPTPARAPGADASAAISTGMYLFGAASPSSTTATEEYIPDTWTTKTAMSSNRGPVSASTASDIAYVMGGIVSGTRQTTVESYVVDTWTARATAHRIMARQWTGTTRFVSRLSERCSG